MEKTISKKGKDGVEVVLLLDRPKVKLFVKGDSDVDEILLLK